MRSKYNRAIVYDLETGGLSSTYNSITELAMVVVDLDSLEIIEEMSVVFQPRVNLNWINKESPIKDAKIIYKNIGIEDEETKIKTLRYKGHAITLKNLEPLIEDIEVFYFMLEQEYPTLILNEDDLKDLEQTEFKDIALVFKTNCYNPQALAITGIPMTLLKREGVSYEEAFTQVKKIVDENTIGNSKPIIVGHNIGSLPRRIVRGKEVGPDGFDNPFMEIFFRDNGDDWFYSINDDIVDTIKWARMKWMELPGFNLGIVSNEVGLTLKEAHRALPDTVANAKFYIKMMKHLRGEGSAKSKYKRKKYDFQI